MSLYEHKKTTMRFDFLIGILKLLPRGHSMTGTEVSSKYYKLRDERGLKEDIVSSMSSTLACLQRTTIHDPLRFGGKLVKTKRDQWTFEELPEQEKKILQLEPEDDIPEVAFIIPDGETFETFLISHIFDLKKKIDAVHLYLAQIMQEVRIRKAYEDAFLSIPDHLKTTTDMTKKMEADISSIKATLNSSKKIILKEKH
jgi:hypothetical protein